MTLQHLSVFASAQRTAKPLCRKRPQAEYVIHSWFSIRSRIISYIKPALFEFNANLGKPFWDQICLKWLIMVSLFNLLTFQPFQASRTSPRPWLMSARITFLGKQEIESPMPKFAKICQKTLKCSTKFFTFQVSTVNVKMWISQQLRTTKEE